MRIRNAAERYISMSSGIVFHLLPPFVLQPSSLAICSDTVGPSMRWPVDFSIAQALQAVRLSDHS